MNATTRLMSKKQGKQEMAANLDSQKLDDLLTKMNALLELKNDTLVKINKLEKIQNTIVKAWADSNSVCKSHRRELRRKCTVQRLTFKRQKIEELENRSKQNNMVICGVEEGSERDHNSMEEFIGAAIFQGLMNLERYSKP